METVKQIKHRLARIYNVTVEQMEGRDKTRRVTIARHDAIKEVKKLRPHLSTTQIAMYFNRDRSTICYVLNGMKGKKYAARRAIKERRLAAS